jgi:hypothetical protein
MSRILLYGGLLRLNNPPLLFKAANIALRSSPAWLEGILYVNNQPYYRFTPTKDHFITVKDKNKNKNDLYQLAVNEKVVYSDEEQFIYNIDVKLDPALKYKNTPYADFFKYY